MAAGAGLRTRVALAALLASTVGGCASRSLDLEKLSSPSDEIVWQAGQAALEGKDWENARQYFRRIIDAFPQSQYQPEARIALADSYAQAGGAGNYILAISAYREFLTLYPSHPRAAYAQYQAAEGYYEQKNSPDRDQTATLQALEEYQRLLDVYPDSEFVEPARERVRDCRQTLARSDFMVGYFYQRTRKAYRAAIARYEGLLRDYPDYAQIDEVIFRLAESLAAAGRFAEARPQIGRLLAEHPSSEFVDDARKLLAQIPEMATPAAPANPAAAEPAPPAPTTPAAPDDGPPVEIRPEDSPSPYVGRG